MKINICSVLAIAIIVGCSKNSDKPMTPQSDDTPPTGCVLPVDVTQSREAFKSGMKALGVSDRIVDLQVRAFERELAGQEKSETLDRLYKNALEKSQMLLKNVRRENLRPTGEKTGLIKVAGAPTWSRADAYTKFPAMEKVLKSAVEAYVKRHRYSSSAVQKKYFEIEAMLEKWSHMMSTEYKDTMQAEIQEYEPARRFRVKNGKLLK